MAYRALSLLISLSLAGCADVDKDLDTGAADTPADTDYAAGGEHAVGYAVLEDGGVTYKAWYPTASEAPEEVSYTVEVKLFGGEPLPFLGAAVADAAPDAEGGPYPLVVLSHGFGMNPEWYHQLAEHLASHGFVVMGPEHMEYDWAADVITATALRPLQVSDTIDLAEGGALGGVIDTEHVAVIGHSYGGYTALASGGARVHTDWMYDACADNTDAFIESMFCDVFIGGEQALADEMGLSEVPEGLWPSLADDRIDAVIAMAPDAFLFGDVGLAELEVPAMMLGGTGDTAAPWGWGGGLAYEHISSETRAMVAFEGAEHFIVTTTCDHMPWAEGLPEEYYAYFCEDPAWDKQAALDLTNELSAAFLAHTLAGAEDAALDPVNFAGVDGLEVRFE